MDRYSRLPHPRVSAILHAGSPRSPLLGRSHFHSQENLSTDQLRDLMIENERLKNEADHLKKRCTKLGMFLVLG